MTDMDENNRKIADELKKTWIEAGRMQFEAGIGAAVVALMERGEVITIDTLIDRLRQEIECGADLMIRSRNEAAEEALLAAMQKSSQ